MKTRNSLSYFALLIILFSALNPTPSVIADEGEKKPADAQKCKEKKQETVVHAQSDDGSPLLEPYCTHDGDPDWAMIDPPAMSSGGSDTTSSLPKPPCGGDGVTGNRFEVIYAVPQNKTNNYATRASSARSKAQRADRYLDDSTSDVDQHFRWLCDGATKEIVVRNVTIIEERDNYLSDCTYQDNNDPTEDYITMTDIVCSLQQQTVRGWGPVNNSADQRIYMVFLDDEGIWSKQYDSNNNFIGWSRSAGVATGLGGFTDPHTSVITDGPGYAAIGKSLWDDGVTVDWTAKTALHEAGHTMGAVPNWVDPAGHNPPLTATKGGHCTDEFDAMCYDDSSGTGVLMWDNSVTNLTYPCPSADEWKFDCRKDTYYDPTPTAGEYLYSAQHINVARNTFLQTFSTCATSC